MQQCKVDSTLELFMDFIFFLELILCQENILRLEIKCTFTPQEDTRVFEFNFDSYTHTRPLNCDWLTDDRFAGQQDKKSKAKRSIPQIPPWTAELTEGGVEIPSRRRMGKKERTELKGNKRVGDSIY